jgi:hypothetical protein
MWLENSGFRTGVQTVMANNKYRADNLAAIANLIINKDKVFLLTTTTNSGQLRPT